MRRTDGLAVDEGHRAQGVSCFLQNKVSMSNKADSSPTLFDGYVEIHNIFEVMIDEKSMKISITLAHGEIETT
jgi:hypothetical protein